MFFEKQAKYFIWVLFGLIMLLPLYVNSNLFFPYISSKSLGFRVLVEVLLLVWLFYIFVSKNIKIKIDWLTIIFFLFLFFLFISSLFGVDFSFSFWSNIERSEGLLLWLHLFVFFFVLRNFIQTRKEWNILLDIFFFVAQFVALVGFLQYLGVDFINKIGGGDARVASTIGNAAYLAGYLVFATFFGLYLNFKKQHLLWKFYYLPLAALDVFVVLQTGTRGAFIALIMSFFLFVVYNIFASKNKKLKTFFLSALVVLCFLGLFVYVNKDKPLIQNNSALHRITSISLSERTAQTRLMTWNSAWQGFKERPFLGYGQDNFQIVFNKYFNPEIYSHAGSQIWFDRAHNIFIDHLVNGGLIGFILYLIFIFLPLWIFYKKNIHQQTIDRNILAEQFLWLSVFAFVIQGLFVFEAMVTYLPLLVVLALFSQENLNSKITIDSQKIILSFLLITLVSFPVAMYFFNIKELRANRLFIDSLRLQATNINQALEDQFKVIDMNSSGANEFRRRTAEWLDGLIVNQQITPYQATKYIEKLDQQLLARVEDKPYDVANDILLMRHYNYTYVLDPNRLYEVEKIGQIALEHSPTRPQIYSEIGYADAYLYKWMKDQKKEDQAKIYQAKAIENFDNAIALNNDVVESYVNMIMVLLTIDQPDKVQFYIDQMDVLNLNYKKEDILNRMANSAIHAEYFQWSEYFFKQAVENFPGNPQNYINLALSYANLDDKENAIKTAEQIKKFGGEYTAQADGFIQKIKTGTFVKQ